MANDWPRSAFQSCAATNPARSDAEACHEVQGIDVAAIAFVAKASGRHAIPRCGLHDVDEEIGAAMDMLLTSGSECPPAYLSGADAFVEELRHRNHRGALALVDPALSLDRDGAPVGVSFRILSSRVGAGYVRARASDGSLEPHHNVGGPTDAARYDVSFEDSGVRIEHWQRFGLRNPAHLLGRYGRGKPAPLGWIRVTYWLGVGGQSRAHVGGSYLPSCWFYRDWMRVYRRDMLNATRDEIESVVLPAFEEPSGTTWMSIDTSTGQVHTTV